MKKDERKWQRLIDKFQPHKDYDLTDYYGVSLMKTKRYNKYRLKLIYDYGHNSIMSPNCIEVSSFNTAIEMYRILDMFSINKGEVENADDILNDMDDDEEEIKETKENPWK